MQMCTIEAQPAIGMVDSEVCITIGGLNPYQKVTLHSFTIPNKKKSFEAVAHYIADKNGKIDVTTQPSLGGSYQGVHPMGFIWAMKPSPGNAHSRFMKFDVSVAMVI